MYRILLVTALALSYSSVTYACCGGGYSLEEGWFNQADISRNQQITPTEAKRLKNFNLGDPQVFAKYDKSGEGVITYLEFVEYVRLRADDE